MSNEAKLRPRDLRTSFVFEVLGSTRSKSHIGIDLEVVCNNKSAFLEWSGNTVTFKAGIFKSSTGMKYKSICDVIDCKHCLEWWRKQKFTTPLQAKNSPLLKK